MTMTAPTATIPAPQALSTSVDAERGLGDVGALAGRRAG